MLSEDTNLLAYDHTLYHKYAAYALSRGIEYTNRQICYHTTRTIGGGLVWLKEDTVSLERRIRRFKKLRSILVEKMIAVTLDATNLHRSDVHDRRAWCQERLRQCMTGSRWALVPRHVYLEERDIFVKAFVFKLEADALLFKLKWA